MKNHYLVLLINELVFQIVDDMREIEKDKKENLYPDGQVSGMRRALKNLKFCLDRYDPGKQLKGLNLNPDQYLSDWETSEEESRPLIRNGIKDPGTNHLINIINEFVLLTVDDIQKFDKDKERNVYPDGKKLGLIRALKNLQLCLIMFDTEDEIKGLNFDPDIYLSGRL